jgi:hypothetical protein
MLRVSRFVQDARYVCENYLRFHLGQDMPRPSLSVNNMNEYTVLFTVSPTQLVRQVIARVVKQEAPTPRCGKSIRLVAFRIMRQTCAICNSSAVLPALSVEELRS